VRARAAGALTMPAKDRRTVLPNGQPVYGSSRTDARYQQLFINEYFRPEVRVRPGMTVLDVGANIGVFSLELLRRCDGDAHVYAFEPSPETFGYLERNLRELFPGADAQPFQCAVGDHKGAITLYHRPRQSTTTSIYPKHLSDPDTYGDAFLRAPPQEFRNPLSMAVRRLPRAPLKKLFELGNRYAEAKVVQTSTPMTTIADVLAERQIAGVDFVKIDVEGAELDVLRGVGDENWPKIQALAAEVHDFDDRVAHISEMLSSLGFSQILVEQNWPFEGTNVYTVHAARQPAP
jgi:FkbM family methyltransferase